MTALFDQVFIAFADVVSFERRGYDVVVVTGGDCFTFERLGNLLDAFQLELARAFNAKVRRALFVRGAPDFAADGEFGYAEPGCEAQGRALIEVYDDCVCLLPPDDRARRIPFAFMNGLQRADFTLTLGLDRGEQYRFVRLGNNADAFEACVRDKLHRYRENALDAVRALDGSLNPAQLRAIAGIMPEGVAVPIGTLAGIAPSTVAALEARIAQSRAADTYAAFTRMCDPAEISVGMKTNLAGEQAKDILWFIAPSSVKAVAAVELALDEDTAAATFVYTVGGDRADFIRQLNRAMEAIDFHREVISLPDDQLGRAEYSHYAMAVRRTAALRFMRRSLAARVIHSSPEAWTREMRRCLGFPE